MAEHHILHVRLDEDGDRDYSITCPYDLSDMGRPCVMWWECGHPFSDEDLDRLADIGEEPCPEGAEGIAHHGLIDGRLCHPTRRCFPAGADGMTDAAHDLNLAPGEYPVDFDVEDFTGVSLYVIQAARGGEPS